MTKIMLVEDDKSLREIYGVRLLAEGYDIVSAGDGEEALAMAIKERPQLIISDVMMPNVSGYDMLDILRSTTETKNIRVIMMTALSSEEQRNRAESLGADRYLVKSQVGIEDVVRVVHEILEDAPAPATPTATPTTQATQTSPVSQTPPRVQNPASLASPSAPPAPLTPPAVAPRPVSPTPVAPVVPVAATPRPATVDHTPKPASLKSRVIQPLNDPNISPVNINDLLDKELAKEAGISDDARPVVESVATEKATLEDQLRAFSENAPEPTPVVPMAPEATPQTVPATTPATQPANPLPSPNPSTPSTMPTPGIAPVSTPATPPTNPPTNPPASDGDSSMAMPSTIPVVEPTENH